MTSVTFCMEVNASILCHHFDSVNAHLLQLVTKFIPLGEAISRGDTPEAKHCPNIFQQLPNDVRGKLMELHLNL
jgi:hypothetical protein